MKIETSGRLPSVGVDAFREGQGTDGCRAAGMPHEGDTFPVSSKGVDVLLDPLEGLDQIWENCWKLKRCLP